MIQSITPNGFKIQIQTIENKDYLSLTDLAKFKSQNSNEVIKDWIRLKSTLQFLTVWEEMYNPEFQKPELHTLKTTKNYSSMSPLKWIQLTKAIGVVSRRGRYDSGIYAHKDIALEFLTWISPTFKLCVIQELQRLKEEELQRFKEKECQNPNLANPEWLTCRALARANYQIQTDAIQTFLTNGDSVLNPHNVYATEADLINKIIFGMTAQQFREVNPNMRKNENLRDFAEKNQVLLVSNLETLNSMFIAQGKSRLERFELLTAEKNRQLEVLNKRKKLK